LNKNTWKQAGLHNSARGILREVYWLEGSKLDEPDILMIEFVDFVGEYNLGRVGTTFMSNLIPFSRNREYSEKGISRSQFCIDLGYASSYHKA
jgi:hypothetical protein